MTDEEIRGQIKMKVDDQAWANRYLGGTTGNWWPGKKVLFSPAWIDRVSWLDSQVRVALTREAIRTAPEYIDFRPIAWAYEDQLHVHYGQPTYWMHEGEHRCSFSPSDV